MVDDRSPEKTVQIIPPDRTLQKKVSMSTLDAMVAPQTMRAAQKIIMESSDKFLEDSLAHTKKIALAASHLNVAPDKSRQALDIIVASAFLLKASAALGGYDLISTLAKSLQQCCEQLSINDVPPQNMAIINWHVNSLNQLLSLKVKGLGGEVGEAILAELRKLGISVEPTMLDN